MPPSLPRTLELRQRPPEPDPAALPGGYADSRLEALPRAQPEVLSAVVRRRVEEVARPDARPRVASDAIAPGAQQPIEAQPIWKAAMKERPPADRLPDRETLDETLDVHESCHD